MTPFTVFQVNSPAQLKNRDNAPTDISDMQKKSNPGQFNWLCKLSSNTRASFLIITACTTMSACERNYTDVPTTARSAVQTPNWIGAETGPILPIVAAIDTGSRRVQLGKALFHDPRLSANNSISCASCHDIGAGGDDGLRVSTGVNGAQGEVNAPTVLNSALNFAQFWDGRAATLEEQAIGPIHNELEMGTSLPVVLRKLADDQQIVSAFNEAFDDGLTSKNLISAIASYEAALITVSSFDRYLLGEDDAISDTAKLGFEEFKKLGCVSCHQGQNVGGNMYQYFGIMGDYFADRGNITPSDFGRYNATGNPNDKFKFKVPSLRNVALTAPYFHDGSAATLEDAITVMVRYQLGRPINEVQVERIVAFLETLTGEIEDNLL